MHGLFVNVLLELLARTVFKDAFFGLLNRFTALILDVAFILEF